MFALNLIPVAPEVGWLDPYSLGWMVIVIAWSIIGTLWMAASLLSQRASESNGLAQTKKPWVGNYISGELNRGAEIAPRGRTNRGD